MRPTRCCRRSTSPRRSRSARRVRCQPVSAPAPPWTRAWCSSHRTRARCVRSATGRARPSTRSPGPAKSPSRRPPRRRRSRGPSRRGDVGSRATSPHNGKVTDRLPRELMLGPLRVDTPVVLAPRAGITNAAYRRLCREQGALRDVHSVRSSGTTLRDAHSVRSSGTTLRDAHSVRSSGTAGLYVCEMITSRGLVERDETTMKMLTFDETEDVRSVQLYGTDPVYVAKAAEILCAEYGVAHIDLNFGCPVPKVTRKGGGGALPWKRRLLG